MTYFDFLNQGLEEISEIVTISDDYTIYNVPNLGKVKVVDEF